MSVAEYEQGLADSILRDKVMRTVAGSAWAAGDEARKYYDFLTQQRTVEYLYLPAADFAASVKPTEEELNAWYEAHKAELASQPRVEVEYVAVAPEGLVRPESVSAEAALKWYEANKQRFDFSFPPASASPSRSRWPTSWCPWRRTLPKRP